MNWSKGQAELERRRRELQEKNQRERVCIVSYIPITIEFEFVVCKTFSCIHVYILL